jgi:uncharacterized protein with NAD-binding domain and iron-sulfur cluster
LKHNSIKKVAIIGAGWAGLAAAIDLTQKGAQVTVFEAAPQAGGRARTVRWKSEGQTLEIDNGQHILIGAYRKTLALLRQIGIEPETVLERLPFGLPLPEGWKLKAPHLPAPLHLLVALFQSGYTIAQRRQLCNFGYRVLTGARKPGLTVQQWLGDLKGPVWDELIEPLCVAAKHRDDKVFQRHGGLSVRLRWLVPLSLAQTLMPLQPALSLYLPSKSRTSRF